MLTVERQTDMQQVESLQGFKHIHFIGIGGIGVSALAYVLHRRGYSVSGSDPARNAVTDRLEQAGIPVFHVHKPDNMAGASLIVATSAAKDSNPEIRAALEQHIPVWPRARMLGCLVNETRAIVVTGAHGKTTVTAMITKLLTDTGLDPTAFIGGDVAFLGGNARMGLGEWSVTEGDESDGSFVYLKPEVAIVNNIDADHLDHYADLDAITSQFKRFLQGVKEGGWVLTSADCPRCQTLPHSSRYQTMTYGFAASADIRGIDYVVGDKEWGCSVLRHGQPWGTLRVRMPGKAHTHNALAAVAVAGILGLPFPQVQESLRTFESVKRRLEYKGSALGIEIIDDYAHHPTEIRSTIQALRDQYQGRLIAIFQPHLYSRTLHLLKEFSSCFKGIDQVVLTDIYAAREEPVEGVTGEILLEPVRKQGVNAVYMDSLEEIPGRLVPQLQKGDVVVTLGAGDVWKTGEEILRQLRARKENPIP